MITVAGNCTYISFTIAGLVLATICRQIWKTTGNSEKSARNESNQVFDAGASLHLVSSSNLQEPLPTSTWIVEGIQGWKIHFPPKNHSCITSNIHAMCTWCHMSNFNLLSVKNRHYCRHGIKISIYLYSVILLTRSLINVLIISAEEVRSLDILHLNF